jgi:predicted dehydrogenase/threonine dehydrogenase-like Zn-dependent dehydrogenase
MKQVLRKGLKHIVVEDVPDPVVQPHHVLVRPQYSLISAGTETASIHRDSILREVADNPSQVQKILKVARAEGPLRTSAEVLAKFEEYAVLGYSGAGILVDRHSTVSTLDVGARVAYGGEGTGHAEYILTGSNLVARVPESVPFEHAAFATLGSIAMNAVRIADIALGDRVAVIGLGLVGQLILQLARLQGAETIGVDLLSDRVDIARDLGADHALIGGEAVEDTIATLSGGIGVDCAIVAAAGKSSAPSQQASRICRDRGRIVVVGAVDLHFPWEQMYLKEIKLFMARAYGPGSYDPAYEKQGLDYPLPYVRWTEQRNMEEFLRRLECGQIHVAPLVSHQFALEEADRAYDTIMDPSANSLAVLLRYPADDTQSPTTLPFEPQRKVTVTETALLHGELGVGLVGAGNIARWAHLPSLTKIRGVRLRGVYSTNGARGRTYATRFRAAYCCSDYQEILRDPDISIVVIASRNQHHAAQTVAALEAGKHVFVEKPMALTEEECRTIIAAERGTGKFVTVGFNRRFAPDYRDLKRRLATRSSPAVLNCRVNSPGIAGSYWMVDPSSGGAILGEAVHFVDLFCWLLDAEPIAVSAFSLPTDVAEPIGTNNLAANFRFADGSIASLTYTTVGSTASAGERVEAFWPGTAVHTQNFKRIVTFGRLRRAKSRLFADKGYLPQMQAFIDAIRQGEPPAVTALDGARATIACLRTIKSAEAGAVEAIDLIAIRA